MTNALCVGGPLDGQFATGTRDSFYVTAPYGKEMRYNLSKIVGEKREFSVWLYEKVTPDEAIEEMIRRYSGPEE